ncbi:hypothetical protein [Micromonospora sp. KC207]|uniref:hypothetical protein n=1 Tax=Micromonospora sp. KC207 TaxID=2530377 RepID=UPI001A9FB43E|nr:hypothetical protein [Micromonospora sp. KC207]
MPQLDFANSFWQSYDVLEKPVKAGVRKAMEKFQQLSIAELHADKGLHLESVNNARDPRMRTIRITDLARGGVSPDDGSDPSCSSTCSMATTLRTSSARAAVFSVRAREALYVSWSGPPSPFLSIPTDRC